MIRFACEGCGSEYNVKPELAGKQARCKKCGSVFTVPAPQPAAADDPLGLNLDLGALGPLDDPRLGAAMGSPLGPSPLGTGQYRPQRKKRGGGAFWLLIGGAGLGGAVLLAVVAILIVTLTAPARSNGDPMAYLPPNWSAAASLRLRKLLDAAAAVPQLKPQIEQALANSVAQGFDVRNIEAVHFAQEAGVTSVALTFGQPVDTAKLFKDDRPFEQHRGMQVYVGTAKAPSSMMPGGTAPGAPPFYFVAPTPQLIVIVSDPARLKAAIDQSFNRPVAPLDLPQGHDLAIRVKNLNEVSGQLGTPPNPMTNGVIGFTATLQMTDNLTFDVVLDTKNAPTAAGFEQQVKLILQFARGAQPPAQPPAGSAAQSPNFLDAIKIAVNGNQFRLSGSVPVKQLAAALPPPGQGPALMGIQGGAGGAGPAGVPGAASAGAPAPGTPP